jgi:hypothetical protein
MPNVYIVKPVFGRLTEKGLFFKLLAVVSCSKCINSKAGHPCFFCTRERDAKTSGGARRKKAKASSANSRFFFLGGGTFVCMYVYIYVRIYVRGMYVCMYVFKDVCTVCGDVCIVCSLCGDVCM